MYKLQFVNAFTQEIIREVEYHDRTYINKFLGILESADEDLIIFDNKMNYYTARYLSHAIVHDGYTMIYRVLFKTKQTSKN
ncbi:hypothetical protein V7138_07400 [Bacillus sp. JJ1533]|uniref:hypothetical protein n=1 Tax=Bacillus sp. JJ1533 TaxID=3122959 RepID=UPI0030009A26